MTNETLSPYNKTYRMALSRTIVEKQSVESALSIAIIVNKSNR